MLSTSDLQTTILGPVDKYRGGRYEEIRDAFVRLIEHFENAAKTTVHAATLATMKSSLSSQTVNQNDQISVLLKAIRAVPGWTPPDTEIGDTEFFGHVKNLLEYVGTFKHLAPPTISALAVADAALTCRLSAIDTQNEIDEYKRQIARLEKHNGVLRDNVRLTEENSKRLADIEKLHRAKADKNYWAWQGDGGDHLESLTCPIMIYPEQLRALISPQPPKEPT